MFLVNPINFVVIPSIKSDKRHETFQNLDLKGSGTSKQAEKKNFFLSLEKNCQEKNHKSIKSSNFFITLLTAYEF